MSRSTPSESRPVGPFALLALGVNGIVGVGIFFVPATLGRLTPGRAGIAVFALTALALVPVALVFAALGRRFDEDGGPVLFARAAFGELFSFLVGWLAYVSAILSASAVMFGLASALAPVLGFQAPLPFRLACAVLVTGLCLVVASGISISAFTWTALTVLKLLPARGPRGRIRRRRPIAGGHAPQLQARAIRPCGHAPSSPRSSLVRASRSCPSSRGRCARRSGPCPSLRWARCSSPACSTSA